MRAFVYLFTDFIRVLFARACLVVGELARFHFHVLRYGAISLPGAKLEASANPTACDELSVMHKLILEVCDGNHASLLEPIIVEKLDDLPVSVMQAVEDFIDVHDGAITTPLVITARADDEPEVPCGASIPTIPDHQEAARR